MPLRPELTVDQLREIQARRRGDADLRLLLWEIARLREALHRAESQAETLDRIMSKREEPAPVRYRNALDVPYVGLHASRAEGGTATVIGFYLDRADYVAIVVDDRSDRETKAGQLRAMAARIYPDLSTALGKPPRGRRR